MTVFFTGSALGSMALEKPLVSRNYTTIDPATLVSVPE